MRLQGARTGHKRALWCSSAITNNSKAGTSSSTTPAIRLVHPGGKLCCVRRDEGPPVTMRKVIQVLQHHVNALLRRVIALRLSRHPHRQVLTFLAHRAFGVIQPLACRMACTQSQPWCAEIERSAEGRNERQRNSHAWSIFNCVPQLRHSKYHSISCTTRNGGGGIRHCAQITTHALRS